MSLACCKLSMSRLLVARLVTVAVVSLLLAAPLRAATPANQPAAQQAVEQTAAQAAEQVVEQAEEQAAEQVIEIEVEKLHQLLLEAMQTPGQQPRETLLRTHVLALFDVPGIARISLGKTWRQLGEQERADFILLLGELIVATYADRFDSYNNQSFVTDEVKPVSSGMVVVTRLVKDNGDIVTLDYYLRRNKVFNVVADGVSDLSLRRADYNSIVKNEGFDSLLVHIRGKLAEARGEPATAGNGGC